MDAQEAVAHLRSPATIRERCRRVYEAARSDLLEHFRLVPERLPDAVETVVAEIRKNYPALDIPYHSRWRHFVIDRVDHATPVLRPRVETDARERLRVQFELAVTSVLLDAGAGAGWCFQNPLDRRSHGRSEGLALASFYLFADGAFSSNPDHPFRADAEGLQNFSADKLAEGFQVSADNPLVGLEKRAELLRKLGEALTTRPSQFGGAPARIGDLADWFWGEATPNDQGTRSLPAAAILRVLLDSFSSIWPSRLEIDGQPLGDVWRYPVVQTNDLTNGLIPFHKLSQWLAYSLVEPLEESGLRIVELDALTGLPEYRNGGLFVDLGVLEPKHPEVLETVHSVDSEAIVEWRALTVCLLDEIAKGVRAELGCTPETLPLSRILQGGTWSAGRALAQAKRPGGAPPIQIESDGTVF